MEITLHGGVNNIGGNCVLIEDEDKRLLFDYGVDLRKWRKYYEFPFILPRDHNELIKLGVIPNPEEIGEVDACFISHLHADHYKYPAIKTKTLFVPESELLYFRHKVKSRRYRKLEDISNFEVFDANLKYTEKFNVYPILVIHSSISAVSYVLLTSDGVVIYTGDFKLHGRRCKECEEYDTCKAKRRYKNLKELVNLHKKTGEKCKVLICEGTNLGRFVTPLDEKDVEDKFKEIFIKTRKAIIIYMSPIDIERLLSVIRAAKSTASKGDEYVKPIIVGEPDLIYIIEKYFTDEIKEGVFGLTQNLAKYATMNWYIFDEHPHLIEEGKYIFLANNRITEYIRKYKPPRGSVFIYSQSEPSDEETEIKVERLNSWLSTLGIPSYHVHSSGHAYPWDLRDFIESLNPEYVIPIHTTNPEMFKSIVPDNTKLIIPEKGINITVK